MGSAVVSAFALCNSFSSSWEACQHMGQAAWESHLRTALIDPAKEGAVFAVVILLRWGAEKDAVGILGYTPLMGAAERGHLRVVKTLLAAGADHHIRSTWSRHTVLHLAASGGHDGVVNALLAGGADKDALDSSGETPLIRAADRGHVRVVKTLLAAGADSTIRSTFDRCTALHKAARDGHDRMVDALLAGGADKDALDLNGDTPLMRAVEKRHLPVVKTLLAAGADSTIRSTLSGATALHQAARIRHNRMVYALLDGGADKDALDDGGETPLMYAADEGLVPAVKTLLAAGADVTIGRTTDGGTALHVAGYRGHDGTMGALLTRGVGKDALDNRGRTPLIWAANEGHVPAVKTLLAAGADVNITDTSDGITALHLAARGGHDGVVDVLLAGGADKDALDSVGYTPLMGAAGRDHLPVVKTLLATGADETVEDANGETPADKTTCQRVHQLLSRAPADRAWRRRGWLVMFHSRALKARAEPRSAKRRRILVAVASAVASDLAGLIMFMLRAREGLMWVDVDDGVDANLVPVVPDLLELVPDEVFRIVVSFL